MTAARQWAGIAAATGLALALLPAAAARVASTPAQPTEPYPTLPPTRPFPTLPSNVPSPVPDTATPTATGDAPRASDTPTLMATDAPSERPTDTVPATDSPTATPTAGPTATPSATRFFDLDRVMVLPYAAQFDVLVTPGRSRP
jgi:hypothetical protein